MSSTAHSRSRAFLAAVLAAACNALGTGEGPICTDIGCTSGITVHLPALPSGPYEVEILVGGTGSGGLSYAYECVGGPSCQQDVFFPELVLDRIIVRVTTPAGSRLTEIANPMYVTARPNGPNCPPVCRQARVTADLPS
jgi:hypothetical protein